MEFEDEIRNLKRRVDDLEGAVSVLTGQIGRVHPELVTLTETTAQRFDRIEGLVAKVASSLETVNTQVWSLRDDLPSLVLDAIRKSKTRKRQAEDC
ncbi:MAG: hypothetical protein AB7O43_10325 [Hyphomicrobiaceae bacterium]